MGLYNARKADGWDAERLTPILAGVAELVPWIVPWHDEPDPETGERAGGELPGVRGGGAEEAANHGGGAPDLAGGGEGARGEEGGKAKGGKAAEGGEA